MMFKSDGQKAREMTPAEALASLKEGGGDMARTDRIKIATVLEDIVRRLDRLERGSGS